MEVADMVNLRFQNWFRKKAKKRTLESGESHYDECFFAYHLGSRVRVCAYTRVHHDKAMKKIVNDLYKNHPFTEAPKQ